MDEVWGAGARRAARPVVLCAAVGTAAFALTFCGALLLGEGLAGSALAALLLPLALSGALAVGLGVVFTVASAVEQQGGVRRMTRLAGVVAPLAVLVAVFAYATDPAGRAGRPVAGGPVLPSDAAPGGLPGGRAVAVPNGPRPTTPPAVAPEGPAAPGGDGPAAPPPGVPADGLTADGVPGGAPGGLPVAGPVVPRPDAAPAPAPAARPARQGTPRFSAAPAAEERQPPLYTAPGAAPAGAGGEDAGSGSDGCEKKKPKKNAKAAASSKGKAKAAASSNGKAKGGAKGCATRGRSSRR